MNLKTNPSINREFNRLRSKWRSLTKELKELNDLFDCVWIEFYPAFQKACIDENIKDPFSELNSNKKKEKSSFFESDEMKEKYRNAAKLTHPDLSCNPVNNSFQKISKAKNKGCLNEFYEELNKNKINKGEISFSEIIKLEEELGKIKLDIENILNSIYFKWYYESSSGRSFIMKSILENLKNK